jgi:glycerol-3-phosphate dehydrogenase
MNRTETINRIRTLENGFDLIVIGGGASGAGCALDAAARGLKVLLLERSDFGQGTSSRSTKLIHGGVRYLARGDIPLVREALRERGILKQNAPHLVATQGFIIPCYGLWQKIYYGFGLKIYDLMAGRYGIGRSEILSRGETLDKLPNLKKENLTGGVRYFDGRFDDARLLIELIKTAAAEGALVLNYARVFGLTKDAAGKVAGVEFEDGETGELYSVGAQAVINATGAFADDIRRLTDRDAEKIIAPSRGVHLVFDRKFLDGDNALMIPQTSDGRVLFIIPWHGKMLAGTTDTPVEQAVSEPEASAAEIGFILETCRACLENPPEKKDIRSVFAGIRPLVGSAGMKNTARLSRDHTIEIDEANLITLTGGKWTTYRNMAEDAVNRAIRTGGLPERKCVTKSLEIKDRSDAELAGIISERPFLAEKIHEDFSYRKVEIVSAVRYEMARTVEDVLARRTRILFLDAVAAKSVARETAEIIAAELGRDAEWIDKQVTEFVELAGRYLIRNEE